MPVETIECQIVQGQLGRYLSGDAFSAESLFELESHISGCELCRAEVAKRKATLQDLLAVPGRSTPVPTEALIAALRERTSSTAVVEQPVRKLGTKALTKPLLYGTGLALILLAMSYIGNNPTSVLGARASDALRDGADFGALVTNPKQQGETAVDNPATSSAAVPKPAVLEAPLTQDEWTDLGLAAWLDYDLEVASSGTAVEWTALADFLLEEAPAPAQLPASATGPIQVDQADAPTTPVLRRSVLAPKPRAAKPRARPTKPRNTIRVYDPSN